MSAFNSTPLCFFFFTFLLNSVIAQDALYNICSNAFNYTSGSTYEKNLNTLLGQLSDIPPSGFAQGSVGRKPDTVRGLALCRGDVSSSDCKSCVDTASKQIVKSCPTVKSGVIWYDPCLLRYSNVNFLGTIDSENKFALVNTQNVTGDAESFNKMTDKFLRELADKASQDGKLFTADEVKIDEVDKLYGLVQCSRDLSSLQCKKCLDDIITELPTCCDARRGGRILTGSCNFRYEIYPFIVTAKK